MKNSKMMSKTPQNQSIYKKIQFQNDATIFLGFLIPVQKEVYLKMPKRYDSEIFSYGSICNKIHNMKKLQGFYFLNLFYLH